MDKTTFLAILRGEHAAWEGLLAKLIPLGDAALTQPAAAGEWSVKDVIAHITWFEREMVGMLRARALVGSELWDLPQAARNDAVFELNRARPLPDVLAEAGQVYADLVAALEGVADEDLADPARYPGMPADWVPWQVIAGNSYEHYQDHSRTLLTWLAARKG